MIKQRLPRPCSECGERFIPTGRFCKLCYKCRHHSPYTQSLREKMKKNINIKSKQNNKNGV